MVQVARALAAALGALVALLAALSLVVPLDTVAWVAGLAGGLLVTASVAHAAPGVLGPADLVTLTRALLACVVAALVAQGVLGDQVTPLLVTVAATALALDAVDGRVARATGTQTGFGARFDGEADAFLLLVLSVPVAQEHGAWVLLVGLARYAFWGAGVVAPWLRAPLPRRDWRKVVTAVQGIALVVAASGVLPTVPTDAALLVALGLLAESFGRDVVWLARHRAGAHAGALGGRRLPVP
ncbi:CDP-alcohol phosphatidyltransferase family protein [Nocardioides sp. GXQ0305]|uniref:CDP-alcohol phosphatidyltransferase family protein n=1 Tax=Nocardioides sp. GXQ0305 TaxID=3423912 RepID=UPI003D7DB7DD